MSIDASEENRAGSSQSSTLATRNRCILTVHRDPVDITDDTDKILTSAILVMYSHLIVLFFRLVFVSSFV